MTTVAWDGTSLAADRRASACGTPHETRKLFVSKGWVYGGSGPIDDMAAVAEWFGKGAPHDETLLSEIDGSLIHGLAVERSTGRCFSVEGGRPRLILVRERFTATGSGMMAALAAMALGKNARQAVELAARFDIYTGGGVDVVRVGKRAR